MSPPPSGAGLSLDPRLLRLVDWRRYGLGLGLGLLAHAAQLGLAACLVAALLDRPPWAWAAGLLALRLGAALGAEWLAAGLADEAKARARAGLWASSARRGVGEGVAATTTAFVQGVEGLAPYFQRYLPQLGLAALAPALVLVCVLILDPLSGLLLALTAPLLPLFMILIGRKTAQISRRSWGALMAMGRRLFDLLGALEDLVLLGAAPQQIERLKAEGERLRQAASEVLRFAAASALALELIATLSTAIIAVQIGLRALSGGVDLERALLILLFTPELYQPLRALGARFHAGMSGISALEAVATPPTPPPGRAAPVGPLRLDAVSVRYPEDPLRDKALSLISLTIHQGERLAIWGPSGAGKSTLARLILGELSPDEGAISVAGVPLAEIDALAWRAQLGYAPQSPLILGETFASALRMAAPEADDARLEAAARAAGAWGFIAAREGGLLASIGAGGARLSGGERRRLALAQVILRGAPYVVLDEPTAHLDEAARAATLEAISGLRPEGAALIITHDPQLAARCDRVARLERGRLVSIDPPEAIADLAAPIIAAFTPPAPPAPPAPGPALRLIGAWLLQHPLALSAALLLGTGAIGASVGLMGVAGALIVTAAAGPPLAALQMMILGVRALGTLRGPLRYAERLITHDLSFALTGWLRARVFEGLAARAHLDPPRRGAALAQIIEDVDALQRLVIEGLTPPWVALCVLLGVGLAQARLSLTLALITVGGLLAAGLVAAGFGLAEARRGRRLAEAEARLGGAVEGA
ncbi:ATP-binding cassette domain-containing protein, partial [Myxococcota bacterium]|nr:ATP-binding cassette domain-containing protein [Myxococcota bacterium]